MEKKYNIIHVCEFLGMQTLRIGLILVLEGGCILLYLVKVPFWDSTIYSNILFWTFLFKNTKLSIKKKSWSLFSNILGQLEKGQINIFFF